MKITPVTNNTSFYGGLKKNLRRGESILADFKKEYPYIKSFTFWQQRLDHFDNKDKKKLRKSQCIAMYYSDRIDVLRKKINEIESLNDKDKYIECLKNEVRENGFGNCGEIVQIISDELDKRDIPHKNIKFTITGGKNTFKDHVFTVIGMKKNAIPSEPHTWGNNAVIIDGWRNFVLSVPDGIREYEKFYQAKYNRIFRSDFNFKESHV